MFFNELNSEFERNIVSQKLFSLARISAEKQHRRHTADEPRFFQPIAAREGRFSLSGWRRRGEKEKLVFVIAGWQEICECRSLDVRLRKVDFSCL